jgi:hypothetical protein
MPLGVTHGGFDVEVREEIGADLAGDGGRVAAIALIAEA